MKTCVLARCSALVLGTVWPAVAWASQLPDTPVDSWVFIRNDNGAALSSENTNSPQLGPAITGLPNTIETAAIVGTWGDGISLQIGEVARITGGVAWSGTGDGSSGLRFGLFNSDGNLLNGSPGYIAFLGTQTDDTFQFTRTANTASYVFGNPVATQNLNATVLDEQGTWQDEAFSPFAIEVERTGSDSTEVRFYMSSFSDDPVNIETVATHNGGAAARTFDFNTFGVMFSAASNGPDIAGFLNVNVAVMMPGDYNQNGVVDTADYIVWRKNLGSEISLPNDVTPGVDQDDYNRWRANFGRTAGSGAGASVAVPEPTNLLALVLGILGAVGPCWWGRLARSIQKLSPTRLTWCSTRNSRI